MDKAGTPFDRTILLVLRLIMAWTFLYAASQQVFVPGWTAARFLNNTKTLHDLFAPLASPGLAPIVTFLVSYGHLLIGLCLLVGLMVRVSAGLGIVLMVLYWLGQMDFPYIIDRTNYVIDFHIVYAVVLVYLIGNRAGHVAGLDAWLSSQPAVRGNSLLRWATAV